MIKIKTSEELECMREAGLLAAKVLMTCVKAVEPGVTTAAIDALAAKTMKDLNCESASLGYYGYPGYICISVNEEVIHGIPSARTIKVGDVVSLDVCIRTKRGYNGDNAYTVMVGVTDPSVVELVEGTERALAAGVAAAQPGSHLSDVSAAIEKVARECRLGIVREYCGHGIGRSLHEEPEVVNYGKPGRGPVLKKGMTICIEPMLTRGSPRIAVLDDEWTVVTCDSRPAAHFEHTVAITETGNEVLTPR